MSIVVPFRLPSPIVDELDARASQLDIKRATLLTRIVTEYLSQSGLPSSSNSGVSLSDVLQRLDALHESVADVYDRIGEVAAIK